MVDLQASLLTWSRLLHVDTGRKFMGASAPLLMKHDMKVRHGQVGNYRQQGIVKRFNRTLAERVLGASTPLLERGSSERWVEWVRQLTELVAALNEGHTRLLGEHDSKLVEAIMTAQKPFPPFVLSAWMSLSLGTMFWPGTCMLPAVADAPQTLAIHTISAGWPAGVVPSGGRT